MMKMILMFLMCGVMGLSGVACPDGEMCRNGGVWVVEDNTSRGYAEGVLGVTLYQDAEIEPDFEVDTHGGFHGDGEWLMRFSFDEAQARALEVQLAAADQWNALPLPQPAQSALDYIDWRIPKAQEGYWFFLDKQTGEIAQGNQMGYECFERYSLNWVLAVYDAQTRTLYFAELDT